MATKQTLQSNIKVIKVPLVITTLYKDKFLCGLIWIKERLTNVPKLDVWNLSSNETG
jgi:hypothetical protein